MSYSQAAPPVGDHHRAAPRARRPGLFLALLLTSALAALSGVFGAVLVFAGGTDMAETNVKDVIDDHPDVLGLGSEFTAADFKQVTGPMWDELISDRQDTLTARATMVAVFAAFALIATLLARKAATWSRVLITLTALVSLIPHFLIVGDYEPASVTALSYLAIVASALAVVLCWLPAVGRYGREMKARG
ncbi:hypothetical protein AAHZ94_07090 [Streptomyces sp. HSW2009]|uniref:hypothetical protein n=1 Tax=Streptomyces sp. HSW2009 TaxID=3142890 RepID=UPI0032EB0981